MVNIQQKRWSYIKNNGPLSSTSLYLRILILYLKVALKEVIMVTMTTAMVPLLPTAWGQGWVDVVGVANAMAPDMDHHPLSMVPMLIPQFLWYMALSPPRSMLTRSSTSSASMAM